MSGAEGARGALAMDPDLALGAVDLMRLGLGDVVADVVDQPHAELTRGNLQGGQERVLGQTHHHLTVDPRVVGGTRHARTVSLALGRREGRAGELAVGDGDVVLLHRLAHDFERVLAGLVTEPA